MQYILTEDEYKELNGKARNMAIGAENIINDLCRMVATESGYGCIRDENTHQKVCDECPVEDKCKYQFQEWSQ